MGAWAGQGYEEEDTKRIYARLRVLTEALEYYADARMWIEYPSSTPLVMDDQGARAKAALQKADEIKNARYF